MIKKHKTQIILTSLVTLLPMAVGLLLWTKLPDKMAIHFDADNTANGWGSKAFVVLGFPMIMLGVHLLAAYITAHDPRKQNISGKMYALCLWICPVCSLLAGFVIYASALGMEADHSRIAGFVLGILFIIIGSYMPKLQHNYTIGIKVPWTLHDEDNWNRTHRFAGKLWVLGGAALIISVMSGGMEAGVWVVIVLAIIPMIYSLVYDLKKRKDSGEQ